MLVVSSHELVRCGNSETPDAVAVDTAGDVSSGSPFIDKLPFASFVSCAKGGKHRASPPNFSVFLSRRPRFGCVSALLVTTS